MPTPDPLHDKSHGIRLQKAMADAGVASRRACETLIQEGRVRVNGQRVDALPAWVDPAADAIEVDGKPLARPRKPRRTPRDQAASAASKTPPLGKTYLMVYKPRGVISTNADPEGRKRVIDLVDAHLAPRLYPVGRLDADSTGLILLTDDGDLTHRLTHPSFGVTKQYRVTVKGKLSEKDLAKLRKGFYLAPTKRGDAAPASPKPAKKAKPESVRVLKTTTDRARGDRTVLSITLTEGQNREIRRILARLGFKVRKLHRTAIGPVTLKGLRPSGWRPLTPTELSRLRRAANPDA